MRRKRSGGHIAQDSNGGVGADSDISGGIVLMYENMMASICSKRSMRRLCCNAILIPLDDSADTLCESTKAGNCHYIDREYIKDALMLKEVRKESNPNMETKRVWGDENYSFQFWMNPFIHIKAWSETLTAIVSDADISVLNDPISAMDDVKGISYACDDPEFDFRANAGFIYQTANDETGDILQKWVLKMEEYGTARSDCPAPTLGTAHTGGPFLLLSAARGGENSCRL